MSVSIWYTLVNLLKVAFFDIAVFKNILKSIKSEESKTLVRLFNFENCSFEIINLIFFKFTFIKKIIIPYLFYCWFMFKFTFIKKIINPYLLYYQLFFKTFKNYQDYGYLLSSYGKNEIPVQIISLIFMHLLLV